MKQLLRAVTMLAALAGGAAPAAMLYVDPGNPGATDSGAGDALHPYRTLTYAMKQLRPGDTLSIAGGVYRESLIFPAISWSAGSTVIQPLSSAPVLIKGSDVVTGWTPLGGGLFVKNGWTVNSQQVFVDGVSLQQIGGKIFNSDPWVWPGRVAGGIAELTDNSFYYDIAAQNLYIKVPLTSLAAQIIEVSVRPHLVFGSAVENVTLRQLHFQHANTTALNQTGAVHLWRSNRNVLEQLEVTYCDGAGFDITGEDNVLRFNKANYNGQLGMKVRGKRALLQGNETSYNNTRRFQKWWEAGGAKFVGEGGLIDSTVMRHVAVGNAGDGIWFDWMNTNNHVYENVSAYNAGIGIHYEASQKGYIYNNYVFVNKERGIYLPHSSGSIVAFNVVVQSGYEGIVVVDEGSSPDNLLLRPVGNLVHGNIVARTGRTTLILPLELADNRSDFNLFLGLAQPTFSLGWPSSTSPIRIGLDKWRAASEQDMNSSYEAVDLPAALLAEFEQKVVYPNWTELLAIAAQFSAPAVTGIPVTHGKPGPSLQLAASTGGDTGGNTGGDTGGTGGDTGGSTKPGKGLGRNKNK